MLRENEIKPFSQLNTYNGKIVAECDFEVDRILYTTMFYTSGNSYLLEDDILKRGCFIEESSSLADSIKKYFQGKDKLYRYLKNKKGYAIHIKNLHIFDKPRELYDYGMDFPISPICKAPQNMMYANGIGVDKQGRYVLISIKPEWLCKILNGEKTIDVRKKVLREMLK